MTILSEHDLQKSIIAEVDLRANQDPRWGLLMAIPNGQYRKGQRMEPGLRAGMPDLFLPIARHGYHGLFIELKVRKMNLSDEQKAWRQILLEQGYFWSAIRDEAEVVIQLLEWYLEADEE